MAQSVEPYKNLNHALKKMRIQIIDGLDYAINECPRFDTPEEIFQWLQLRTVYKKDPKNREVFQTLPTLLDAKYNIHGISGAGDCDCLTIAALTLLTANNFINQCGIVLVGRNRFVPVHIYAYVYNNGKKEILDLTNQWFNYERDNYSYKQEIQFNLTPLEEKEMILELADGFDKLLGRKSNPKKQATKQYHAQKKQLKRTEKIQNLIPKTENENTPSISKQVDENYTYLPESAMHVRNDYFDDLDSSDFQNTMLEEGVEPYKILELSAGRAKRKAAKKATPTRHQAAKQKRIETKQEAKTERRKNPLLTAEQKQKLIGNVKDTAGNLIKKYTGGSETETETPKTNEPKMINIFGQEFTQTQVILGGAGILILGTIAVKSISKNK